MATTLLVQRADQRISVIRINQQVGSGEGFRPAVMQEALIADAGGEYVLWSEREQIARTVAAVTILPHTLLTRAMTTTASEKLAAGKARVGLALKPGQVPSELKPGYRVQIIHAHHTGQASLLAPSALVDSVVEQRNGTTMVTVVVDSAAAPEIGARAAAGDIVIVELSGER
ncbi:hypothetical protein [Nonomuraea harbinensis]|uniref:SAF domain-containing protein n=1 Tax=Nonomuraea harbinensis TaxID=1286938 RepID=A0ABW1BMY4_9ACTN|nr:hypothetical protein [Nonomuraea harbinensis]